jgi:hypothetical protein
MYALDDGHIELSRFATTFIFCIGVLQLAEKV